MCVCWGGGGIRYRLSDASDARSYVLIFVGKKKDNKCLNETRIISYNIIEPHHEKTGFLPRRKQRRRSASR